MSLAHRTRSLPSAAAGLIALVFSTALLPAADLSNKQQLGKSIFFDQNLSLKKNQSCAACHAPNTGFTGPRSDINAGGSVYEGSVAGRFGNRKPPSSAYATQSPLLHAENEGTWRDPEWLIVGGNFWDGRATGYELGNPAADQALGPFLNPLEQALPDSACVVHRVCSANYPVRFSQVWGSAMCSISWPADVEKVCAGSNGRVDLGFTDKIKARLAFSLIGLSVAEYESSAEVNQFTSKYDYYLRGSAQLTDLEKRGLELFNGKAKCALCHPSIVGPRQQPPLFTDFTYDNLGVPKNAANPFYTMSREFNPDGLAWIDKGLGAFLKTTFLYKNLADENMGKQKVPTLRNVDKRPNNSFVKAFGHNGYFKTLKGIVNFYNTRDTKARCADPLASETAALAANCWPAPEFGGNVNTEELGNLMMTNDEELAVIEFLKTLSDGYRP
jgi:cytochrome c peroxidase